jgi:hypothetical protein
VAGGRRIHEKLYSGGHGHRGPEVNGGGPHILEEIIGDLLEHFPPIILKNSIVSDHQYHSIGDEVLMSYWRCSNDQQERENGF